MKENHYVHFYKVRNTKILKLVFSITFFSDSSKRRRTVRSKVAALKKIETEMFTDYLLLTGKADNKENQDLLEKGILPWLNDSSQSEGMNYTPFKARFL